MADWRFFSLNAVNLNVRAELDLTAVSITDRLKGVGSLSAGIPLYSPHATHQTLDVEGTVIAAERDGVVLWAGQLRDVGRSRGADVVSLGCEGYWSFVRGRTIRSAASMTYGTAAAGAVQFSAVDQFRIVDDLIDHVQGIEDLGITVQYPSLSGVVRDRSYEADKDKSVGEAIEQLADVSDGFDWALVPVGGVDNLSFRLELRYPLRGRQTGYVYDLVVPEVVETQPVYLLDSNGDIILDTNGAPMWSEPGTVAESPLLAGSGNVIDYSIAETSRNMVSRFTAVGPGEGAAQLTAHATNTALSGVIPLRERGGSWLDVTQQATLDAHAQRQLTLNARRNRTVTLTVDPDATPRLGSYILGDTVALVDVSDGWADISGPYRIMARTISVSEDGAETVDLELVEEGRF